MNTSKAQYYADKLREYGYQNINVTGGKVSLTEAVLDESYHKNLWSFYNKQAIKRSRPTVAPKLERPKARRKELQYVFNF
jgi:hypothetical protein